jgi:hypothetical protein
MILEMIVAAVMSKRPPFHDHFDGMAKEMILLPMLNTAAPTRSSLSFFTRSGETFLFDISGNVQIKSLTLPLQKSS